VLHVKIGARPYEKVFTNYTRKTIRACQKLGCRIRTSVKNKNDEKPIRSSWRNQVADNGERSLSRRRFRSSWASEESPAGRVRLLAGWTEHSKYNLFPGARRKRMSDQHRRGVPEPVLPSWSWRADGTYGSATRAWHQRLGLSPGRHSAVGNTTSVRWWLVLRQRSRDRRITEARVVRGMSATDDACTNSTFRVCGQGLPTFYQRETLLKRCGRAELDR